jgi:hypothetical protein
VTALFAIAVVCLLLLATWDLSASHTRNSIDADNYSAQYAEHAKKQIQETCVEGDLSVRAECAYEITKATNDAQNAERDLSAQQDMAGAALWMLSISGVGLILSLVGLFLVRETLTEMARQRDVSEQTLISQSRPWLKISSLKFDWMEISTETINVCLVFKIKNVGFSPAFCVTVRPRLAFDGSRPGGGWLPQERPVKRPQMRNDVTIFQKSNWTHRVIVGVQTQDVRDYIWGNATRFAERFTEKPGPFQHMPVIPFPPQYRVEVAIHYQFVGSDKVHETSAFYMLSYSDKTHAPPKDMPIPFEPGHVDVSSIEIVPGDVLAD